MNNTSKRILSSCAIAAMLSIGGATGAFAGTCVCENIQTPGETVQINNNRVTESLCVKRHHKLSEWLQSFGQKVELANCSYSR